MSSAAQYFFLSFSFNKKLFVYAHWVSIYTPEAATLIPFSLPILSPTVNALSPATFWLRRNNLSRRRRFSPATAASKG